jgi:hypothetical protein
MVCCVARHLKSLNTTDVNLIEYTIRQHLTSNLFDFVIAFGYDRIKTTNKSLNQLHSEVIQLEAELEKRRKQIIELRQITHIEGN